MEEKETGQTNASWMNRRKSQRFAHKCAIVLTHNGQRCGAGQLIDISRDGAAFLSFSPVKVGQVYNISIKGIGVFNSVVVRRFDVHNFGVEFRMSEDQKRRLAHRIDKKFEIEHIR
ncbi:MAG: PilZ domain-containing protein [Pseudomonadota bacterium]